MALKGDYGSVSQQCQDTVDVINERRTKRQGSAKAEYVKLDDPAFKGKFKGTTHMMMMGTNNLAVFDVITKWTDKNIDNPMLGNVCKPGYNK